MILGAQRAEKDREQQTAARILGAPEATRPILEHGQNGAGQVAARQGNRGAQVTEQDSTQDIAEGHMPHGRKALQRRLLTIPKSAPFRFGHFLSAEGVTSG